MKNGQVYTIIGDKLSGKPFELEYVPPGSKGEANS